MSPEEQALRKRIQANLQAQGMNRREARRALYGATWKTKHPTRRSMLAEAAKENARARKSRQVEG
jgi:hypothetical protein